MPPGRDDAAMQSLITQGRSRAAAALLLGLCAGLSGLVPRAAAQAYPCPGGPGAGEQQVGMGGGSHGVAAVPMCVSAGGGHAGGGAPPAYDPMAAAVAEAWREAEATHHDVLEAGGEAFRAAVNLGGWDVFEAAPETAPGESCTAFWIRPRGDLISISGPASHYEGGMLTFWSERIPKPDAVTTVTVTLTQSGYPAQTVKALNFAVPGVAFGAIGLTVPSIEAAIGSMLDDERMSITLDGTEVASVAWSQGHAARDRLRDCVARRTGAGTPRQEAAPAGLP
jgi:hypothetical protein